MNSVEAAEHLQVIRTLMERSTIYRRALKPIMFFLGLLGIAGAGTGLLLPVRSGSAFAGFWSGVGVLGILGAFLMGRRQAFQAREEFWSPQTRRVTHALLPPIGAGAWSVVLFLSPRAPGDPAWLVPVWMALYGCALHAAGFSMPRGIQGLGWCFLGLGAGLGWMLGWTREPISTAVAHIWMALGFGGLHWSYALCLQVQEPRPEGEDPP